MKKIVLILGILVLLIWSTGVTHGAKLIRLGHIMAIDHPHHAGALKFAELVEAKTQGSVRVRVFPAAQLGGALNQLESLKMGTLEAFLDGVGIFSQLVKDYNLVTTTYALRDSQHFIKVMEGDIGKEMGQKLLEQHGIRVFPRPFLRLQRHLISKRPVKTVADVKGLKLRIPQLASFVEPWKTLGASPTPIAFPELYLALRQGVVEGAELPLDMIYANKFYEGAKYISLTAHLAEGAALAVNENFFRGLTSSEQKAVAEAAREAADYHNKLLEQVEDEVKKKLLAEGVSLITVNVDEFRDVVKDVPRKLEESGLWSKGLYDRALSVK